MNTIKGEVEDSLLEREVIEEIIPCGRSITTKYFLDGEVVRQDVNIIVDTIEPAIGSVNIS